MLVEKAGLVVQPLFDFREYITNDSLCTICYHLYNFKNVKNTYGRVLLLIKLQAFNLQLY